MLAICARPAAGKAYSSPGVPALAQSAPIGITHRNGWQVVLKPQPQSGGRHPQQLGRQRGSHYVAFLAEHKDISGLKQCALGMKSGVRAAIHQLCRNCWVMAPHAVHCSHTTWFADRLGRSAVIAAVRFRGTTGPSPLGSIDAMPQGNALPVPSAGPWSPRSPPLVLTRVLHTARASPSANH